MIGFFARQMPSSPVRSLLALILLFFLFPFYEYHPAQTHALPGTSETHSHPAHFHSFELESAAHSINLHPVAELLDESGSSEPSMPGHGVDESGRDIEKNYPPPLKLFFDASPAVYSGFYFLPALTPLCLITPVIHAPRALFLLTIPPERSPPSL
jgi:hypothetical protein